MMSHDEEAHVEVQDAEQKIARRGAKKRRCMRVAGKSVFMLGKLLRKGPKNCTSVRRRRRRR